jgi:hypothetical protein
LIPQEVEKPNKRGIVNRTLKLIELEEKEPFLSTQNRIEMKPNFEFIKLSKKLNIN